MTSYYLTGRYRDEDLWIRSEDFYQRHRFQLHRGEACVRVDSIKQEVLAASGKVYPYDKLLIATGGYAVKPEIKGSNLKGVFVLRTLADAKKILNHPRRLKHAVVIGGGFVSLKAAYALMERGIKVTSVVTSGHILSRILDIENADALAALLMEHGMRMETGNDVTEIIGDDENTVAGVLLKDGRELAADLVIIGKGVRPAVGFLSGSGIAIGEAIDTDVYLRTNRDNVFAAGDCIQSFDLAEREKRNNALWPNAAEQGIFAGDNMSGRKVPYPGSIAMNAATFFDRAIIGAGMIKKGREDGFEVAKFSSGKEVRRRLVFRDDVLVGYFLMGRFEKAGILTNLLKTGAHLGKMKKELIEGNFSLLSRYA